MKKKVQIMLIHGGMTFKSKRDYLRFLKQRPISVKQRTRWDDRYFRDKLGRKFEIIKPKMPLAENARYSDWKIHFERHFPYLRNNVILIGVSLGGIFLAKFLSENKFPKKILSTYLIAPPFDDTLPTEELAGGFKLKSDLSRLDGSSKNLVLLFSKDDDIVPVSHSEKYRRKLNNAKIVICPKVKGHFNISKFPGIVKFINESSKKRSS
jgi:predicted alpha/beta hydrolase family esterase